MSHKKTKFNLREAILLDSQSTMDLFCNKAFVQRIYESQPNMMQLKSNGGNMRAKT